ELLKNTVKVVQYKYEHLVKKLSSKFSDSQLEIKHTDSGGQMIQISYQFIDMFTIAYVLNGYSGVEFAGVNDSNTADGQDTIKIVTSKGVDVLKMFSKAINEVIDMYKTCVVN